MDQSQLIALAVEQTRDYALLVLDPAGNVLTWNTGAANMTGYRPEEILGRHFSVFYTHDSVQRGWPAHELKVAAAEGRFEDEDWRVSKDGSRFWANVVITAIRDSNGKLVGFSKVTRNLTERKEHEEALAQSEERFRLLVESVQDYAIFMLDPQGLISSWNWGAQCIIGYRASEVIGKHFSRFFTDEDLQAHKPWEELATARELGRFEGEGWRLRNDGSRFWARAVVTALYDSAGNCVALRKSLRIYPIGGTHRRLKQRRAMSTSSSRYSNTKSAIHSRRFRRRYRSSRAHRKPRPNVIGCTRSFVAKHLSFAASLMTCLNHARRTQRNGHRMQASRSIKDR